MAQKRRLLGLPIFSSLIESVTFMPARYDRGGMFKSSGKLLVRYTRYLQLALKSSIRETFYFGHLQLLKLHNIEILTDLNAI